MDADDGFASTILDKATRERYHDEKKQRMREIKVELTKDRENFERAQRTDIESQRRHRQILNSCIYPFNQDGPLRDTGYEFIRASPLCELGAKNVDFLLYKRSDRLPVAIFGECKGDVKRVATEVADTRKKIDVIKQNVDHIKQKYLELPVESEVLFEYVVAVPVNLAHEFHNQVLDTGGGVIVWKVNLTSDPKLTMESGLSLTAPPRSSELDVGDMMHREKSLNTALLDGVATVGKFLNVFPQSHSFLELTCLVCASVPGISGLIVRPDFLRNDLLAQELFYLDSADIDEKAKQIIDNGIKIGAIEWSDVEQAYRLKSNSTKSAKIEEMIETKWISHAFTVEMEGRKKAGIIALQEEFRRKFGEQKSISQFLKSTNQEDEAFPRQ
jgi:hypothetical protein